MLAIRAVRRSSVGPAPDDAAAAAARAATPAVEASSTRIFDICSFNAAMSCARTSVRLST